MSKVDDLEKLLELKEKGALTEEEFEQEKLKLLNDNIDTNKQINNKKKIINKKLMFIISIVLIILSISSFALSKKYYHKAYYEAYQPYLFAKLQLESAKEDRSYYSKKEYKQREEEALKTEKIYKKYENLNTIFNITFWTFLVLAIIFFVLGIFIAIRKKYK